jgi:hypothetical protein
VPITGVFSIRVAFQGQVLMEQETKQSSAGTVVDASGLVMIGDVEHAVKAFERGLPGMSVAFGVKRLDATLPGESQERPCALVARDTNLGLAFLQILDLGDRRLPAVDLSRGGDPRIGAPLWGVRRMGRGFDHAPELLRLWAVQKVDRPRRMWGISGDFNEHGLFAFDASGAPAGVVAAQFGSEGVDIQGAMLGGDFDARVFLLPLEDVRAAMAQAKEKVPEAVRKAKEAAASPKPEEKPAPAEEAPPAK